MFVLMKQQYPENFAFLILEVPKRNPKRNWDKEIAFHYTGNPLLYTSR